MLAAITISLMINIIFMFMYARERDKRTNLAEQSAYTFRELDEQVKGKLAHEMSLSSEISFDKAWGVLSSHKSTEIYDEDGELIVIKYTTTCFKCGKTLYPEVEKRKLKDGLIKNLPFLTRHSGKWKGRCNECYENKKLEKKK